MAGMATVKISKKSLSRKDAAKTPSMASAAAMLHERELSIANVIASGDVRAIRITKSGVFRKWYAATLSGVAPTPFMEEFIRLLIKQGPAAKKVARPRHPLAS